MRMPLSRHFYSLDEVQAALLYTVTNSNTSEALFWCNELILSGCIAEAISTLFQSWLWSVNFTRLEWLIEAWNTLASDELTEQNILLATYKLATIPFGKKDCSLWNIIVLTAENREKMPDRVTPKMPSVSSVAGQPELSEIELYFLRAVYQGKARSAWWAAQFMNKKRTWELLRSLSESSECAMKYKVCFDALLGYEKLLGYSSSEYDDIMLCTGILMLSILSGGAAWGSSRVTNSFAEFSKEIDSYNTKLLQDLTKVTGTKDARAYSIPIMCLYGNTVRGRYTWQQNTLYQLHNIEKYLLECPFWDEILAEYADIDSDKNLIKWHSDNKMEEFYDKYFPDDIPDEWTKKDKLKSHGDGILRPGGDENPNIIKYTRHYMGKCSRLAWNTNKTVNIILQGDSINIDNYCLDTIMKYYKDTIALSDVNMELLRPVHRIKVYN